MCLKAWRHEPRKVYSVLCRAYTIIIIIIIIIIIT